MLRSLIYGLVGKCPHDKLSRVFTDRGGANSRVICFGCGASLPYDLNQMRLSRRPEGRVMENTAECQR